MIIKTKKRIIHTENSFFHHFLDEEMKSFLFSFSVFVFDGTTYLNKIEKKILSCVKINFMQQTNWFKLK